MKLEVGMYVRTTTGRIFKIIEVENKNVFYSCNPPELQWQEQTFIHSKRGMECSDNIIKANHNIIDLIEVGDRIKYELSDIKGWFYIETSKDLELVKTDFKETDIKSIVTKEQFSQMEYKVVE